MAALILLINPTEELQALSTESARALSFAIQVNLDPALDPLTQIADLQPALIIVAAQQVPFWMADIRASPATRRIPVLAVGDDPAAADHAGIKDVLSLADFQATLPDALAERVRIFNDQEALSADCAQSPSAQVLKGLHEFNTHDYYECHETLEAAWKAESAPVRELYRAILQVGIAYYQIERGNYHGALKMFLRTLQWFGPLPEHCQGIDVAQLRADATAARAHLEALGVERIADFDRTLLKPIRYEAEHG